MGDEIKAGVVARIQEWSVHMLDVPGVAKQLDVSRPLVRRLIEEGRLPAMDMTPTGSRRTWRVPEPNLDKFVADQVKSNGAYLGKKRGDTDGSL
jgi:excisionase family DNA binding protein